MSTNLKVPPEFDDVSSDEKIAYVQALWDRIAEKPAVVGVPDEHKRTLDERLNAYEVEQQPGREWSEVREELLSKLRS